METNGGCPIEPPRRAGFCEGCIAFSRGLPPCAAAYLEQPARPAVVIGLASVRGGLTRLARAA